MSLFFMLEDDALGLLLYTLLILKGSQFCFNFKKCDQVQKLVRPWPTIEE